MLHGPVTLKTMRALPVLLFATALACPAQSPEQSAVVATVQKLFDAMAAGNTAAARAVLIPDGRVIATRANGTVSNVSQDEFAIHSGQELSRALNACGTRRSNIGATWLRSGPSTNFTSTASSPTAASTLSRW